MATALGVGLAGCGAEIPERRWLEPEVLASDAVPASALAGAPDLAANSRGEVAVAWMQGTGNDLGVWSRRLDASGWTPAELVEQGYMFWEPPRLVLTEGGAAFGLWTLRSPFPYGWLRGSRRRGAGWEAAQLLNDGTQGTGVAWLGALGPDAALAVWRAQRISGQRLVDSLEWSRFDTSSGWTQPGSLGSTVASGDSPQCWSDEAGHAFVLFRSREGEWVARYLRGQEGWGPELPLPAAPGRRYWAPAIAARSGAIDVLWREIAGGSSPFLYERIWVNRFTPSSGWSELLALDTTQRLNCVTALAADAVGSLAVWSCRTHNIELTYGTWYSRVTSNGSWTESRPVGSLPATASFGRLAGGGLGSALATWHVSGPPAELWAATFRRGADWKTPRVVARSSAAVGTAGLSLLPSGEGLLVWVEGTLGALQIRAAQYADPVWREPQQVTSVEDGVIFDEFDLVQLSSGDAVLVWAERAATAVPPSGLSSSPLSVRSSRFVGR